MKRFVLGLAAAVLLALGAGFNSASAATISVDPSPTDSFHVGGFFPTAGAFDDAYQFTLTQSADMTSSIVFGNLAYTLALVDPTNNLVAFNNLASGILYTLHVVGFAGNAGGYGGSILFTQVATTPIPPALLLFATTLAGLGALGFRRKAAQAA